MDPRVAAEPARPSVDTFREAVSRFATGITVVTCVRGGLDHAMTANAFTSVSLDPLLVLVSVERATRFHDAVLGAERWAVSVLSADAEPAARWLATRGRPLEGQLDRVPHRRGAVSGAAVLTDSLATLECRTWAVYDGGDHSLVVGEVDAVELADASAVPLLYHRRHYTRLPGEPAR